MSEYIRPRPSANFHHAIRLAESKGLSLNMFVSINFSLTDCALGDLDRRFRRLRSFFVKWSARPRKIHRAHAAPPTFVWVLENQNDVLNAHWLVHVPKARQVEFKILLPVWLSKSVGRVDDAKAIHIAAAVTPRAAGKYMLKGMYPSMARNFDIRAEYTGWVPGRRIGHSKNIGPVELKRMRKAGKHPQARPWIPRKYSRP